MTAKEKAKQLQIRFFILPEENEGVGRMKGHEMNLLSKQCALIAVDEIIISYTGNIQEGNIDVFWHNPIEYWTEVKQEIVKL